MWGQQQQRFSSYWLKTPNQNVSLKRKFSFTYSFYYILPIVIYFPLFLNNSNCNFIKLKSNTFTKRIHTHTHTAEIKSNYVFFLLFIHKSLKRNTNHLKNIKTFVFPPLCVCMSLIITSIKSKTLGKFLINRLWNESDISKINKKNKWIKRNTINSCLTHVFGNGREVKYEREKGMSKQQKWEERKYFYLFCLQ